jgi:hypothetical protein
MLENLERMEVLYSSLDYDSGMPFILIIVQVEHLLR